MKLISRFVFAMLLLFICNSTNVVLADELFPEEEIIISEKMVNEEKNFREVSGLNTSKSHIINVIKNKSNKASKGKYGAYLTANEIAQVEKILEIDAYVPNIRKMIGETIDKPSDVAAFAADFKNEKIMIYLTEGNNKTNGVKNRLLNTFPYPDMLEFKYVKYSHLELFKLNKSISVGQTLNHSEIVSKAVNLKENKVEIGIYQYNDEDANILIQKYNDMIMVVPGEIEKVQARSTPQYHMQGGLRIGSTPNRSLTEGCTLGFTATRNGEDYVVTAGHCLASADYRGEIYWYQGGELIGGANLYGENYNYDAGLIKLTSTKNATNYIYKYSSFDSKYTRETNGDPYVGQPVCISGIRSGFSCGEVVHPGKEVKLENNIGNRYVAYRTTKSYVSGSGDSGAPVWYGGVLIGIHTSPSTFSHLSHFKNALGITAIVRY